VFRPYGDGQCQCAHAQTTTRSSSGEAARVLGCCPETVNNLLRRGVLPAERTAAGLRLYHRGDVERLAAARAAAGVPRSR
jgi:DNA-binding transcriptional MerR regulator